MPRERQLHRIAKMGVIGMIIAGTFLCAVLGTALVEGPVPGRQFDTWLGFAVGVFSLLAGIYALWKGPIKR